MIIASEKIIDEALEGNPLTEDGIALRFAEAHADHLRYVAHRGEWVKWDGTRWKPDQILQVYDMVRASCRGDAKTYGNGSADRFLTAKTVSAVQTLARADQRLAASEEDFDANDWLLNTDSGTVDLKTGEVHPHNPADYITKRTACSVAPPGSEHPIWSSFLDRATEGDTELQSFLQRWAGYCLTGDTSEQKFIFAYGTGGNGKGTYINTLAGILGEYSTIGDVATFIASPHDRHPADLAKLHCARLVVAQETPRGRKWDETKIKTMTGGDRMTARFMRQDPFDFQPKLKLFVTGNNKPQLDTVDDAWRRRMILIPFLHKVSSGEMDLRLGEKLKVEYPAILRWAIAGCLEWQRRGLAPPACVTAATDEYFRDQDLYRQWLDECTERRPMAFTPTNALFTSWKAWADEQNVPAGSSRGLAEALKDTGFEHKRTNRDRGFGGIVVKDRRFNDDASY
jgi:putative DNA primase/helicase